MVYMLLLGEAAVLLFFIIRRKRQYDALMLEINPKNEAEDSNNMVKSGKTKRIKRTREKYRYDLALIGGIGMAIISFTAFKHASSVVDQHRDDGIISAVAPELSLGLTTSTWT